jgi:hypothetical protein
VNLKKKSHMIDKQIKGIITAVEHHAQNLCQFNTELQVTQHGLEATHWEFEMWLAAVKASTRCRGEGMQGAAQRG